MTVSSGLFTRAEFYGRGILKLAPDAFITVNGNMGSRYVSTAGTGGDKISTIDVRGGVSSINITAATFPPGSNKATIEITAPIYKGLHEDYYFTLPNGTKRLIFFPMMEIKVYMKGYYTVNGSPKYYPTFWGMITSISEDFNDGSYTFSLTCEDLLAWWKYQMLTINPSATQTLYANIIQKNFPSIFQAMNPWQIIWNLFIDTDFTNGENFSLYNFVYPDYAGATIPPYFGDLGKVGKISSVFTELSFNAINYWRDRFGYGATSNAQNERIPLEMFGLNGPIDLTPESDTIKYLSDYPIASKTDISKYPNVSMDFAILSQIQPYGALTLFGEGSEAQEHTKLDIATEVCNQAQMEFYVDTNGSIVFKPPFYNLDVVSGGTKQYIIASGDVINFNASTNSSEICNYLEVTSPLFQILPDLSLRAYHIDMDLLKQYGLRYQKITMRYGDNVEILRLLAAAEMAKINGRAYQGSVTIPLRPEMRLGYPVYIQHLDMYYYVTGISHSFNFGGTATTNLSLEFRRERIFENNKVLKGYVYKLNSSLLSSSDESNLENMEGIIKALNIRNDAARTIEDLSSILISLGISQDQINSLVRKSDNEDEQKGNLIKKIQSLINGKVKEYSLKKAGWVDGPDSNGFYSKVPAGTTSTGSVSTRADNKDASLYNNEAVMITKDTIPYTDKNGYRHIGGFPYGANLTLVNNGTDLSSSNDMRDRMEVSVQTLNGAHAESNTSNVEESTIKSTTIMSFAPIDVRQTSGILGVEPTSGGLSIIDWYGSKSVREKDSTVNVPGITNAAP